MAASFFTHSINGYGAGFFGDPVPRADAAFRAQLLAEQWTQWEDIFENAKRGDFSRTPELVGLFGSNDSTLESAVSRLIAFAGTTACHEKAIEALGQDETQLYHIGLAAGLPQAGALYCVPGVLDSYERLAQAGWRELEMIPMRVWYQLGDPRGVFGDTATLAQFKINARARYEELVAAHGSDRVAVFMGEKVSPVRFAQRLVQAAARDEQAMVQFLRVQFEAYTGINCSSFYAQRRLQPLNVAAIAETFLAGRDGAGFVDGERYFFGHRVLG